MILKRTIGGKRMGGPAYDTADDIFADAATAYTNLNGGGGEPEAVKADSVVAEPETKDVEPEKVQGEKEGAPGTPDKSADDSKETEGQTEPDGKGKPDSEGIKSVREWGAKWEKSAGDYKAKLEAAEPTLKFVEEKFGGEEHLKLASEIYGAVANEDEFDPAGAVEFLSENLPGVANKLVTYIAQNVAERATSTAFERAFGRKLTEQDIKDVQGYLASGKKADARNFDAFQDAETIPDELKFDSEGNERDPQVLDYLWKQQKALNDAQAQLKQLDTKVNGAAEAQKQQAAADAIESYVQDNFSGIDKKVAELGLDKAVEGETAEIADQRTKYASLLHGVVMWRASNDAEFQSMYRTAVAAVAKTAANSKDRTAKATSIDFSRRIKARVDEFAADAAEIISPLIDAFSTKRKEQVAKINTTKPEPITPGVHTEADKKTDYGDDPFDSASIQAAVSDIMRAKGRR